MVTKKEVEIVASRKEIFSRQFKMSGKLTLFQHSELLLT